MLPASLEPSYFTPIPGVPASSVRKRPANPATVRREIALGNYELSRRCAEVSDYNNPLDALQTQLAIAAQEKTIQEDEERQRRRARRAERKLLKSLRKLRLDQHERSSRPRTSNRTSRKATPYVSERSASSSSDSDEPITRTHHHRQSTQKPKYDHKARRLSSPAEPRRHVSEVFRGEHENDKYVSEHLEGPKPPLHPTSRERVPPAIPQIELTVPSTDSRHSSTHSHEVSEPRVEHAGTHLVGPSDHRRPARSSPEKPHKPSKISAAASHHDHTDPDRPSTVWPDNEPPVLHLVFSDGQMFDLSHKELLAGGPNNSFLRSWADFPHRTGDNEVLSIKMPHDRHSNLFVIIHEFLKGSEVFPLSPQHVVLACVEPPTAAAAYKRLYKEAKVYGIRGLAETIKAYRQRLKEKASGSDEPFRVYDCVSNVALGKHDLQTIAQYVHAVRTNPRGPLRAVIVGAAINFMGRTDDTHETLLDYSLVAPLTPISRAFSGIVDCLVDIQAGQIIFEGSLTRDQCRNVILDIVGYGEPTLGGVIAQHKAPVIERDTCTLEHVLSELEPHRSVIWPDVKS